MCLFRVWIRIFFSGGAAGLFSGLVPDNLYIERTDRTTQTTAAVFLSAFFFLFLFLWLDKDEIWEPTYLVSLIVVQLLYLVSGWKRDNDEFVRVGLRYVKSLLSAGLLAGIAYLLAISIFASIQYIFEIWEKQLQEFLYRLGLPSVYVRDAFVVPHVQSRKGGKGGEP